MSGIFISYRREDTGGAAGRLYDRLCDRFGSGRVFRDVDTIAPGERFARKIDEKLAGTDVLIALIGREWITSAGEDGRSRLHDADDFVRLEIGTALRRGIPVIPALVENAQMPRAEELPADLAPLAQCQAIEIDDAAFHEDVGRLISVLVPRVGPEESGRESPGWRRTAVLAAVTVL
ncbi:MAG: toll/interleukin-1 receptor domain-containing protein, partial [Longimicrobiales bacterium]